MRRRTMVLIASSLLPALGCSSASGIADGGTAPETGGGVDAGPGIEAGRGAEASVGFEGGGTDAGDSGDATDSHDASGADHAVPVGAPSAPTHVTAYATTTSVYVLFAPPVSPGTSAVTRYTATTSSGQSASVTTTRIQNESNSLNYNQLNCRVDINGVLAGASVTVTVTASNSSGEGPPSSASNSVTPTAVSTIYVADGKGLTGESPAWGDYSFSGQIYYGSTPGTLSRNGTGSYPAPTNPTDSSANVVEFDNPNDNGGFQPFFHHENPNNIQNGRLNIAPYKDLIISVYPTADQGSFQQGLYVGFLRCMWVNGVSTSSGTSALTDSTQSWPDNIFVEALVTNITTGAAVNVSANTATTLTFDSSMTVSVGDYYEISVPDVGIGQQISMGHGTSTGWGPTNLVSKQWNTYVVPLSAFNGGSTAYPQVSGEQILKFGAVLSSNTTEVHYFSNVGFQ